ncbi:MAG: metallophosphoesterase [Alistipes sp.]|nr:metallophosphoesterase [Alistipes sp.]
MIKIVHISDFHLTKQHSADWIEYISEAFVQLMTDQNVDSDHIFVVCTGDLVDKGGADYDHNLGTAFNVFKTQVLDEIHRKCNISYDHIIIIPGNHDIDRNADNEYTNIGMRKKFADVGVDEINKVTTKLLDGDIRGAERLKPYKDFEIDLYKGYPNIEISYLGSSFRYTLDNKKIGFVGLNSVWNAFDDTDKEIGMFIGEPQYKRCLKYVNDCDTKILLLHHPLDWLKIEKNTIVQWCYRDFDMALLGHVHSGDTSLEVKLSGNIFIDIAPSSTSDIREACYCAFANGISIIDYDIDGRSIDCTYYIYSHKERSYVRNCNITSNGTFHFDIPKAYSADLQSIIDRALQYIKDTRIAQINNSIIAQKANVIPSLLDSFIMPPILKNGVNDDDQIDINLNTILKNKENQIFLGSHECGKTTLLYRLLIEYVEQYIHYGMVPIYINFNDIANREIETIIKEYIDCNSEQCKSLINNNKILLLVDNYVPSIENKIQTKRLYNFIHDNNIPIIATSEYDFRGTLPSIFEKSPIAAEYYYIEPLKSSQIKELMIRWSPKDEFLQRNTKIDKMVSSFGAYSLPCTAMSVSLYLWSTENAEREPVNHAVLLDIYIEIILEKLQKDNIYRNSFDYRNKTMLLACIAKKMCLDNTFELSYSEYIKCIEEYFEIVGFTNYQADKLGEYFISQKIFNRQCNTIRFAHSCFYYFYLANRMMDDKEFKDFILSESEYYKYSRVIDYYTGLKRNDSETLKIIHERFDKMFEPVMPIYDEINIDDCFTHIVNNRPEFIPKVKDYDITVIKRDKPTEEIIEKKLHEYSDKRLKQISDEIIKSERVTPALLIILMSNVLRNSEGVEDLDLKKNVYGSIVRNSLVWTILVKDNLARYANTHNGKLPDIYIGVKNVEAFLRYMPYILQDSINLELGSNKLNLVFKDKINKDNNTSVSDVERFFSVGMYWDNHGDEYMKYIKNLIKCVKNNCVQDYLLSKLLFVYNHQTKKDSKEANDYIDLISDLKIKNEKLPKRWKDSIMKQLKSFSK